MRGFSIVVAMLGYAAVSFTTHSRPVQADQLSAASGTESNGALKTCFRWDTASGSVGLQKDLADPHCSNHYYMPLYWKTFYSAGTNRTITVRGRRADSAAQIDCAVFVYNANAQLVSQAGATFPVTGSNYGSVSMTVNNVSSTGTSYVACSPNGNAWLLKVDWTP